MPWTEPDPSQPTVHDLVELRAAVDADNAAVDLGRDDRFTGQRRVAFDPTSPRAALDLRPRTWPCIWRRCRQVRLRNAGLMRYNGTTMMQRTQIMLGVEEHRLARRKAAGLGVSLAEYVRRLVNEDLAGPPARGNVSALFALGDSGGSDIARHKDAYISEAVDAAHTR